jgi:chromosome segregation ATPase
MADENNLSTEALNTARLSSMLKTLQGQREDNANETVKARSELAICEVRLESLAQTVKTQFATISQLRLELEAVRSQLQATLTSLAEQTAKCVALEQHRNVLLAAQAKGYYETPVLQSSDVSFLSPDAQMLPLTEAQITAS